METCRYRSVIVRSLWHHCRYNWVGEGILEGWYISVNPYKSIRLFVLFAVLVLVISACGANSSSVTPPDASLGTFESPPLGETPPTPAPSPIPRVARLTENHGEVNWRETEEVSWEPIGSSAFLGVGNQIMTGLTGRAVIKFTEGSIVRLAENTIFTVREVSGNEENPQTILELIKGQIFIIINSLLGKGHFDVDFQSGEAAVRGSMLSVRVTPSGRVVVTCLEGHCTLSNGTDTVSLEYGQQAWIDGFSLLLSEATPMDDYQFNEWLMADPNAFFVILEYGLVDPNLFPPSCELDTGVGCYLNLLCDPWTGIDCELPATCNRSTGLGCELPTGCNPITGEGCLLPPGCDPETGTGCETSGGCNLITGEGCDLEIDCVENPNDPLCDLNYCAENPDDPICGALDPCIEDPASCLPPLPDNLPPLPTPPKPPKLPDLPPWP
jgi:hypothetical protein